MPGVDPALLELHRTIGQLEATQEATNRDLAATRGELAEVRKQLATVLEILQTARGGWKTLLWVGSAAAGVGALVTKLVGLLASIKG